MASRSIKNNIPYGEKEKASDILRVQKVLFEPFLTKPLPVSESPDLASSLDNFAMSRLEKAAKAEKSDDVQAKFIVSLCYFSGILSPVKLEEALDLLEQAALGGHENARLFMLYIFEKMVCSPESVVLKASARPGMKVVVKCSAKILNKFCAENLEMLQKRYGANPWEHQIASHILVAYTMQKAANALSVPIVIKGKISVTTTDSPVPKEEKKECKDQVKRPPLKLYVDENKKEKDFLEPLRVIIQTVYYDEGSLDLSTKKKRKIREGVQGLKAGERNREFWRLIRQGLTYGKGLNYFQVLKKTGIFDEMFPPVNTEEKLNSSHVTDYIKERLKEIDKAVNAKVEKNKKSEKFESITLSRRVYALLIAKELRENERVTVSRVNAIAKFYQMPPFLLQHENLKPCEAQLFAKRDREHNDYMLHYIEREQQGFAQVRCGMRLGVK